MLVLRTAKTLALWSAVVALGAHAYFRSAAATALDNRVRWGVLVVGPALLAAWLVVRFLSRRRPERWSSLDADQWGLSLLVAVLGLDALSHVAPQTSIRVLREEIGPLFGGLYPLATFVTPLLLSRTARRRDTADQALWIGLATTTLSGALFLLNGPTGLVVSVVVLLMQLAAGDGRVRDSMLMRVSGALLALLVVATLGSPNPIHASPALAWILAVAALGLAIAARPRDGADWRFVLSAPLWTAVVMALAGALLMADLAQRVDLMPALRTRLTIFRQHPNFLAPFFAFHATVAVGLALSARRRRVLLLLAALLLAVSTVLTDSRAGIAGLAIGLVGIPGLYLFRALLRRVGWRKVVVALVVVPILIGGVLFVSDSQRVFDAWVHSAERIEMSVDYRADAWRNSAQVVQKWPWLGIGPKTFVSIERFQPGSRFLNQPESPHPHNVLLYVAQAAGIPALILFLAWLGLLLARLGRLFGDGTHRALVPSLLSAVVALTLANLLDLGMALDTVVPAPLFVLTGLVLGRPREELPEPEVAPIRPGGALAWVFVVAILAVPYGYSAVVARTKLEQSQLLAFEAGQAGLDAELMARAREKLREAIDHDPDLMRAYELLSRWLEDTDDGLTEARQVLLDLVARAPDYGPLQSLLGQFYKRSNMNEEAAEALSDSLVNSHGSVFLTRDRADAIVALASAGRRDDAMDLLTDALSMGVGVIFEIPWQVDPTTGARTLPIGGKTDQLPIDLVDAIERLLAGQVTAYRAGERVGRDAWMNTYNAFRKAHRNDRALAVLELPRAPEDAVEPHILASERGYIAEDDGEYELARDHFQEAYDVSGNPFFLTHVTRMRQLMGEEVVATEVDARDALQASGLIFDQPTAFRDNLLSRAEALESQGRPADAGALIEDTLLYEDDILERARILERAGDLYLAGGAHADAVRALTEALEHLCAKPFPVPLLRTGYSDSQPGRIALTLCAAWRGLGARDAAARQELAWKLPNFFSWRLGASLFRLGFFSENGQMDALLREAQLQLLARPDNVLAMWSELDALEGLAEHRHRLHPAMRAIAEYFAATSPMDQIHASIVEVLSMHVASGETPEEDDERAQVAGWWRDLATVMVLKGRYREAIDMFGNARALLDAAPHAEAHLGGWQARAVLLADADDIDRARDILSEALLLAPECGMLRRRLEALP